MRIQKPQQQTLRGIPPPAERDGRLQMQRGRQGCQEKRSLQQMLLSILSSRRNGWSKTDGHRLVELLDDAHSHVVRVWGIGRPEQPLSVVEG